MMSIAAAALAALLSTVPASPTEDSTLSSVPDRTMIDCEGNACSDVTVTWDGTGYRTTNIGEKVVEVTFRNFYVTVTIPLAPGATGYPVNLYGFKLTAFAGAYIAKYK